MLMPNDYHEVREAGSYVPLPDGGYVCRIMDFTEGKTAVKQIPAVYVYVDIAEGEHKGKYAAEWKSDTRPEKRWGAIYQQTVTKNDGTTNPFFKGLITSIEKSNNITVKWTDDPKAFSAQFKNKLIGVVFAREEYRNAAGAIKWSVKPMQIHSVDAIRSGNYKVPEPKTLDDGDPVVSAPAAQGWQTLGADDLPF